MSTSETPRTAKLMSIVSHNPAVIITGNVLTSFGWFAPWLKTNIFWAPNGRISPSAKRKACKIASINLNHTTLINENLENSN